MSIDRITQLNRSPRRVLLFALTFIAAIALYRWILSPYSTQLWAAQQYKSALNSVLHKTSVLSTSLQDKKAKIDKLAKESVRLRNQLFTWAEARSFLASLPNIANQVGCTVQSVSSLADERRNAQNQEDGSSGIVGRKAVITVTGGYGNIVKLLRELQNYERKVWIETLKMDISGNTGKLQCQMTLAIYCVEHLEIVSYE